MSLAGRPHDAITKQAALSNRRATIRYRCAPATAGKVFAAGDQVYQRAWIIDLSLKGIGMQLARPIESGRLIIVITRSNDETRTFELSAKVAHCNPLPQGDYYIGCELTIPLSSEELEQIL